MNKRQRKKNRRRDNLFTKLLPRCKWRKRYVLDNARMFHYIDFSALSFSEESVNDDIKRRLQLFQFMRAQEKAPGEVAESKITRG